jgi:rhamnogalacturonyl hydrolase YesR
VRSAQRFLADAACGNDLGYILGMPDQQDSRVPGIFCPRIALYVVAALFVEACANSMAGDAPAPTSAATLVQWGEETLAAIDRDYWLEDRRLYAERLSRRQREGARAPAFMWGAGVQLSTLAAATRVNATHEARLREYLQSLDGYWREKNGVAGYDVQPGAESIDRYYDDNAWIVLALCETFEATGDAKYLKQAEATLGFVLSGEDDALGGGIYWRENERTSKNTCSNAPAIVGALRLYRLTQRAELLATAERLYAWTNARLQDKDGLMWDSIKLDGRVDERKFSYNSALMIRANCLLHQCTGELRYLEEAQRLARAAEAHWIDGGTGAARDSGRFAHLLLEALLAVEELDHDVHWLSVCDKTLDYVRATVRDADGRYGARWDGATRGGPPRGWGLIDQASAARGYFALADVVRRRAEKQKQ